VRIAYQVVGQGPLDLVFVPGFISNLDVNWEDEGLAHLLRRLSASPGSSCSTSAARV
jgi:hypothetical protein